MILRGSDSGSVNVQTANGGVDIEEDPTEDTEATSTAADEPSESEAADEPSESEAADQGPSDSEPVTDQDPEADSETIENLDEPETLAPVAAAQTEEELAQALKENELGKPKDIVKVFLIPILIWLIIVVLFKFS